jgi:D-3-phosphoglycerate dehydrogenase
LNDHTRAIVTARELGLMKTSGVLVNTSRAGLIAPGALHQALVAARPGMAAIDVFDHEPVTDVHDPLLQLPNLVATPHIGYVEMDSLEDQFSEIFEQVLLWQAGQPVHVVNPLVLAQQAQQPPGQDGENTSGVA